MARKKSSTDAPAAPTINTTAEGPAPEFGADILSRLTARIATDFAKVNEAPKKAPKGKKEKKDKQAAQEERKKKDEVYKKELKEKRATEKVAPVGRNPRFEPKAQAPAPAKVPAPVKTPVVAVAPTPEKKKIPAPEVVESEKKEKKKVEAKKLPERPVDDWKKHGKHDVARPPKTVRSPERNPKNRDAPAAAAPAKAKKGKTPAAKPETKNQVDKFALLKEIIELGGNQEDLDLVTGLESDDAEEEVILDEKPSGKKVKNADIEAFMKEIGLEAGKVGDVAEEEVEEEEWASAGEDEEDESEDEEMEDDMMEESDNDEVMMDTEAPIGASKGAAGGPKLLFPKRPDWHAEPLPAVRPPKNPPSAHDITRMHARGKQLLAAENELYSGTHLVKSSDRQFLSQIMQSGTLSDKISALTLVCQESPLHTTKTLETLLGLANKKSRSQTVQALAAIKDLFAQGVVLPPNRKLRYFSKQPGLGSKDVKDVHLLVWTYEDWLKNLYFEVLKTLELLCTDQLVYARNHALGYVYELLKEKPEQESNLLRILVNKLGDTDKKIASKTSYLLLQLQTVHPAMKSIIINAVESDVIFKRGNTVHAQYYSIITLNQTILGTREHDVANRLLNIYFAVFTTLLQKDTKPGAVGTGVNAQKIGAKPNNAQQKEPVKMNRKAIARKEAEDKKNQFDEEVNAKLISAVLTGVNRAFPFSKVEDDVFEKHMDTLFRITHTGNFNTSIQALMLIYQVSSSKQAVSDRFYRTLYESVLDPRLVTSSKQALYLNLLFRALKSDISLKRVKAFVKRILQSASFHQPSFICGVLYLISELESSMPGIRSLITDPEPNEDDEEEVFRDVPDSDTESAAPAPAAPTSKPQPYDGRKRDPTHANADRTCLWELMPLLAHFHPTVSLFASHLLSKLPMPSKPDLGMHTLSSFLDRFVYRNPKAAPPTTHGSSIMQPLAGGATAGMVLNTRNKKATLPLNSDQFWRRKVEDVRPEEVFFHKYFNITQPGTKAQKRKRAASDDEDEEAEEGEVWQALVNSRPDLEGADEDDDVEFDDDEDDLIMDDSDDGPDLDDEDDDAEWGTDESGDEDSDGGAVLDGDEGDAEAAFEAAMAKAQARRAEEVEEESEDEEEKVVDPKKKERDERKTKKRKLKGLPTFASAEDYADMMMSDGE